MQAWTRFAFEEMTFEGAVEAPRLHLEPFQDGLRAQHEPGIDAVYFASGFYLSDEDMTKIAQVLIDKKLPSSTSFPGCS